MAFVLNDISYELVYDLGTDLKLLLFLAVIVLICELPILIKNIGKRSISIRKTLKPLSEMAKKARQLNHEVFDMRSIADGTHIKDLDS